MLAGARFELPVAIAPEAKVTHIKRHTERPSLRLILADAFFFAINLFMAIAFVTMMIAIALIIMSPLYWLFKFILQIVSFCTP